MNKVFKNILLTIGFILCLGVNSAFARDVNIILNDQYVSLGSDAVIQNGRVLVKLKEIYKMGKYEIIQDEKSGVVNIKEGFRYVQFVVNLDKAVVNNRERRIDVKPIIISNKTYIPLRVLEEALGNKVSWDEEKKAVVISEGDKDIDFNFSQEIAAKNVAIKYYDNSVTFVERTTLGEDECYVFARIKGIPSIAVEKDGNKVYLIKENYDVYKILGITTFND